MVDLQEILRRGESCIDNPAPRAARGRSRDPEVKRRPPAIHGDIDVAVEPLAVAAPSVEGKCQRTTGAREIGMRRLDTMPENVRWSSRRAAREKGPSAEHRMSLAKGDHVPHEPEETGVPVLQRPVHPACAVVLAPGIVVAVLTAEELISPQDHGNSL